MSEKEAKDHTFQMRIEASLFKRLEEWINSQRFPPTKAEVIRQALIEFLDREEIKAN